VAARLKAWVCGCLHSGIGGSNLAGGIDVSCMLSGRGLCVGLFARPEELECCRKELKLRRPWLIRSCCAMEKKNVKLTNFHCCPRDNFSLAVF
jgi:hypothetical protein